MFNNSKDPENDNIEVEVENVGYTNQETLVLKVDEFIEPKKLD